MKNLFVLFTLLFLAACGSTSSMKNNEGAAAKIDLSDYDNVVVLDFADATKKHKLPAFAGKNFADRIAARINEKGVFSRVSREPIAEKSIIVSGAITKYNEGSGALRLLVGFGAGSSYFDADVQIYDSTTQQVLGKIVVDKQSWILGGIAASTQTVEGFMDGASKKIAKELAEGKKYRDDTIAPAQPVSN